MKQSAWVERHYKMYLIGLFGCFPEDLKLLLMQPNVVRNRGMIHIDLLAVDVFALKGDVVPQTAQILHIALGDLPELDTIVNLQQ